jgi:hypothetical protein
LAIPDLENVPVGAVVERAPCRGPGERSTPGYGRQVVGPCIVDDRQDEKVALLERRDDDAIRTSTHITGVDQQEAKIVDRV